MRSTIVSTPNEHGTSRPRLRICLPIRYSGGQLLGSVSFRRPQRSFQSISWTGNQTWEMSVRSFITWFLGHPVSAASSVPMPSRVSTVQDFPQPRDVKALQEFLGIMYFYHRFIPNLGSTLRPPLSSHKHIHTASSSQLDQRNDPSLLCNQTSLVRGNYAGPSLHGLSNRSDMRCIWCGHWRRPGTVRTWSVGTTRIFQSTTA